MFRYVVNRLRVDQKWLEPVILTPATDIDDGIVTGLKIERRGSGPESLYVFVGQIQSERPIYNQETTVTVCKGFPEFKNFRFGEFNTNA